MANNMQYGYGNPNQMPMNNYQQSYNGPYNIQQTGQPSQSYTQQYGQSFGSPAPNNRAWADDEYEARSIRVPDGWPADTPFVIWNPRQPIQYIKAIDARGVPYPMKILEYTEIQPKQSFALPGQSGTSSEYVTKDDMNRMRDEIVESVRASFQNQPVQQNMQRDQQNAQRGAK